MRIGVLGSGHMSGALGAKWVAAGHELCIAGRTPSKAAALADRLGANASSAETFAEAVAFGDAVLLAVHNTAVMDTLAATGTDAFAGKTIIDCNNPVDIDTFAVVGNERDSMAERIQAAAPGSSVVKAFNLCQASVWTMDPPEFDGRRLVVPYCGDNEQANAMSSQLIRDMG